MTGQENYHGPAIKSYRDAVTQLNSATAPVRPSGSFAQNDHLTKLRGCLRDLMKLHPEGLPLPRVRQACPHLVHPEVLMSYPSTRQLLGSLPDVVRLQGVGVQTLVLPPSKRR